MSGLDEPNITRPKWGIWLDTQRNATCMDIVCSRVVISGLQYKTVRQFAL